jgi:hypothetical protein
MNPKMQVAQIGLRQRLEAHDLTKGMYVKSRGDNLVMGRTERCAPDLEPEDDDRVRLTMRSNSSYGLSVKRHTGRWERTPFSGTMDEMIDVILSLMQHLVAPIEGMGQNL